MNKSKDQTDDEEGFEDDGLAVEGEEVNFEHKSRKRGKDRDWALLESFESIADYKTSNIYTSELSKMSPKKQPLYLVLIKKRFCALGAGKPSEYPHFCFYCSLRKNFRRYIQNRYIYHHRSQKSSKVETISAVFSKKPIHISFITRTRKDGSSSALELGKI